MTESNRTLELVPASGIQIRQTLWLQKDRIPLGLETLLVGPESYGKSAIASDTAAQVSRGTLAGDLFGEPAAVVYATTEDSWSRAVAPRLIAAGADLDLVFRVFINGRDGTLQVPDDIEQLTKAMLAQGARLLVLDPLTSHVGGKVKVNTHQDHEWRMAVTPLLAALDDLEAACLGIIHFNKGDSTAALDRIMGSRAISATSRAVIVLTDDKEDDTGKLKVAVQIKNTMGAISPELPSLRYRFDVCYVEDPVVGSVRTIRVCWLGETTTTKDDIFRPRREHGSYATSASTAEVLRELLADHGRHPVAEVIAALTKDRRASTNDKTLSDARWKAGVVYKRTGGVPTYHIPAPAAPPASVQPTLEGED
ncbi:MAG: AAA family ATPase [Acidimicrobiales bacterium]